MITIPLIDANSQVREIDLDGQTYFLQVDWNPEGEFWTLTIEDYNHLTILAGLVIVPDFPLLWRYRYRRVPAGELVAVTADNRNQISRTDLVDGTVVLMYATAAEVEAIRGTV